jgi:heptosyltransferase-1
MQILIIRLSAIGDVVMASAVIPALRRAYPEAHIDWLAEPPADAVLRAQSELNEVITWPKGDWKRMLRKGHLLALAREVLGFARRLRGNRYDLVLDLQGLAKSGLWARITGAPRRVGLGSREGSQYLMTEVVTRPRDDERIASEYLRLVEALGIDPGSFPMAPAVSDDDRANAEALLTEKGVTGSFAVIAPFTTRPQKHWVEERWPPLADRIQQELGLPVVMVGGPGDQDAAGRIEAQAGGTLINLTGRSGLTETFALLEAASLCIGVDTGLTHAAIGFGTPTVALFGSTRPYLDPATENAHVLYSALPCSPCRRHPTCGGTFDCMAAFEVDQVLDVAREVMRS